MMRDDDPARAAALLERIGRLLQSALHAGGMPPAQWHTLHYLANANRFSRTPTAIGQYLGATKGTVSQTIIALVRKGLVAKRPDPTDRRSVSLRLTARGETVLARHPMAQVIAAMGALPTSTRRDLCAGLAELLAVMLARQGGRPFGQCAHCRYFQRDGARGAPGGSHRCGLLDVPLSDEDSAKICVEYEPAA
jgi:DNA-binding MarR family transcriptional regulator